MPFSENKNQVVRKSNELIEARYKLSLAEQRVVLLLASEISPNDEDFKDYEIRVSDFAEMFGLQTDKSLYEKVQNASDSLLGRTLQLSTDVNTSRKTAWLSYVEYIKGSGVVKLRFDKSLKPYLLQLKGHYTQYQFNYVMNFKSQYSMRLYELLKMDAFKANKNGQFEKNIEVLELRLILGIDKKDYPLFADFKKRAIEPATREISDKTDLLINDVKYGKTGRKITNITFVVGIRSENETKLRQANLRIEDIKPEIESENHPIVDSLISLGFSFEIAKKIFSKYTIKTIERNIAYSLAKKQENKINEFLPYLSKAIELDYAGEAWEAENQKKEELKKEKARLEKEAKEKEKQDSDAKKSEKQKNEKLLADFEILPEAKKREIIESYLQTVPEIISPTTEAAYKKHGVDVCKKSAQFKGLFLPFLKGVLAS